MAQDLRNIILVSSDTNSTPDFTAKDYVECLATMSNSNNSNIADTEYAYGIFSIPRRP